MDHNFRIEVMVEKDGKIISLDTDEVEIYIYQKSDGGSVRTLEISGKKECTDPGGHQLGLRASVPDDLDEDDSGIEINTNLAGSVSVHSYKYGEGI
ncbi:hypothetical protein LCGC14_1490610 [marine sediment metagenome]|uniref:Uncharacterized protein n=1 Tax=marine sediment metagenome TaxID=412755 RepID=A0A0F9JST8_9ZZZZ